MSRVVEQGGKGKTPVYNSGKSGDRDVLGSSDKGGKCNHLAETETQSSTAH